MNTKLVVAAVSGAVICAGALSLVRAGDLNPPPGSVQPTMHTLDQVFNAATNAGCDCRWNSVVLFAAEPVVLVPAGTSGVVHAVVMNAGAVAFLSDASGKVELLHAIGPSGPGSVGSGSSGLVLDIGFNNGLKVETGTNGSITLIYKTDLGG